MTAEEVRAFERCIRAGGVAVFPTDTVYGIGCRLGDGAALSRIYELKGRDAGKPAAGMWFQVEGALAAVPDVGPRTRAALERLLPGPVLAVLPDGRGVRVPRLEGPLSPLADARVAVVQTSANLSGQPAPRRLDQVPSRIAEGADLVLDAGELSGTPSTVVDLKRYEEDGSWEVLRGGAIDRGALAELLGG